MNRPHRVSRGIPFVNRCMVVASALVMAACGGSPGGTALEGETPSQVEPVPSMKSVLSVRAVDAKTLQLSWSDTPEELAYRLLLDRGDVSTRVEVANLPADTTSVDLPVFLPSLVGARYILQACTADGCDDVAGATPDKETIDSAIGWFLTDAHDFARAGTSVALSSDGNTLAIGAPYTDHIVADSGAVYVFTRTNGRWGFETLLLSSSPSTNSLFGDALAMSANGDRIVVGASKHEAGRGAIHVFERRQGQWSTTWTQADPYPPLAPDAPHQARYGAALALSGDGNTLVVGRQTSDDTAVVYFFEEDRWIQQFTVPAQGPRDATSFALSQDGNTLVIGRSAGFEAAPGSGVVDVYQRTGQTWATVPTRVMATNADPADRFGWSVALAGDGATLAVGAPTEDGSARAINGTSDNQREDSGAVYVFKRDGDAWTQAAYIKAMNADEKDWFGRSVSLSIDGKTLAVGAYLESSASHGLDGNAFSNNTRASGAVYVFQNSPAAWSQIAYIKAKYTWPNTYFGLSLALSGDGQSLAVGAPHESYRATLRGSVYLY